MNEDKCRKILNDENKNENHTYFSIELDVKRENEEYDENINVTVKTEEFEVLGEIDTHRNKDLTEYDKYNLYEHHIIKEELTIGPDIIQKPNYNHMNTQKINPDETMYNSLEQHQNKLVKVSKLCNICFRSFVNLNKHIKNIHDNIQRVTYTCDTCTKTYKDKRSYESHILKHETSTAKCFRCDFCDKILANHKTHKRHTEFNCLMNPSRQNKSSLQFICDLCEKSYTRKDSLEKHIRDHFGMTIVFQCNDCEKTYNRKLNLKAHVQSKHLKIKKHFCKACNKDFFSRWGMLAHERICNSNKKRKQ